MVSGRGKMRARRQYKRITTTEALVKLTTTSSIPIFGNLVPDGVRWSDQGRKEKRRQNSEG